MNRIQSLIEEYAGEKEKLSFFDGSCWLGNSFPYLMKKTPETAEELLKVMDYYGIEKAVASSSLALNYNVLYGNKKLFRRNKSRQQIVWRSHTFTRAYPRIVGFIGSNLAMLNPWINLGRVLRAKIDLEDKEKILGGNACRVFGL